MAHQEGGDDGGGFYGHPHHADVASQDGEQHGTDESLDQYRVERRVTDTAASGFDLGVEVAHTLTGSKKAKGVDSQRPGPRADGRMVYDFGGEHDANAQHGSE